MNEFLLYTAGTLTGRVSFRQNHVVFSGLDFFSDTFSAEHVMSADEGERLAAYTHLPLRHIFAEFEELTELASSDASFFKTKGGEVYQRAESGHYIQRYQTNPRDLLLEEGRIIAIVCPDQQHCSILVRPGYEEKTVLKEWKQLYGGEKTCRVISGGTVTVAMRDGVRLATNLWLPDTAERVPVILVRTPYNKEENEEQYFPYVRRGYAVAVQDVRGRNESEGEWEPFCRETEDGDDTLNWLADQPFANGSVGMLGNSYLGFVQWAAAASGNPHLKCLVSVVAAGGAFQDLPRRGGTFCTGVLSWAFMVSEKRYNPFLMQRKDWNKILAVRPIADIPKKALGREVPFLKDWLQLSDENAYWKRTDWKARSVGMQVPALIHTGWFDDNTMGSAAALDLATKQQPGSWRLIAGPWQHNCNTQYDLHALSFPEQALRDDTDLFYLRWFDRHLKGRELPQQPAVEYYTVGEDAWHTANSWPPENTAVMPFYLGGGDARTSAGAGTLSWEKPGEEGASSYRFDPRDPGTHVIDMSENELGVPGDYTAQEKRNDYLCYTSEPLTEPVTVTGDLYAKLYVSSDGPDTDFIVRLLDVDESGRSVRLSGGLISARYRNGFEKSELLTPGETVELNIRMTKVSCMFRPGHRIRISVTSGAKNMCLPNSNTERGYDGETLRTAVNTLHTGGAHASCILLPVEQR